MKDNDKRMLLKQWVSGFMGGLFAFMVMFNMGAWASVTNSGSGISAGDQAKLDAMTESGGNITFTGNVVFSAGAEVSASQDLVLGDSARICDSDDCDGIQVNASAGWWAFVRNGAADASKKIDFNNAALAANTLIVNERFNYPLNGDTTRTIASGVVSASQNYLTVAAESGTADDLDTINKTAYEGQFMFLRADAGDTITLKHGTGNLKTFSGADIAFGDDDVVMLFYDDGTTTFYVIGH